jgi:hypothetical protein
MSLDGEGSLISDGDVGGAGGDDGDGAVAVDGGITPDGDGAARFVVDGVRRRLSNDLEGLAVGAGDEQVGRALEQPSSAMPPTCSGVFPCPKITSGNPWRSARWWSTWAKPRSSNGRWRRSATT